MEYSTSHVGTQTYRRITVARTDQFSAPTSLLAELLFPHAIVRKLVSYPMREQTGITVGSTYEQTIMAVLVQQKHTRLERYHNLLGGRLAIVRIEDGLATNTAVGGGREVKKKRPGGADWFRVESQVVGVVVCKS